MPASKPFREWNFSGTAAVAFVALLACLFALTNGQAFPSWMLVGLLVLGAAGLGSTIANNTGHSRLLAYSHATATVTLLALGVGVALAARPADPITKEVIVADTYSGATRIGGTYYDLDATDGTHYEVRPGDFQPELPKLDNPEYRGVKATLILDRGTTGILALHINNTDYYTATYQDPMLKLWKGLAIGGFLLAVGGVMAWLFGYLSWVHRLIDRKEKEPPPRRRRRTN